MDRKRLLTVSAAAMAEFWASCGVDPATHAEADISWQLPHGGRLRVNLYHTLGRLAAVLRPIRDRVPALAELGLPADGEWVAFDFWANALTPPFRGRLKHALRPQSCFD